ncbi:MAG: methyltransferase domain-containing protein [Chloroflexota bacterium]|nr:methyltransferase domain-containing protein [Chloroflexota bacterium]
MADATGSDRYVEANRQHWDEIVDVHAGSELYDVARFKAGERRLKPVELGELGDVRGKSLLHLQCHFGIDTLCWARDEGAIVTGIDFSENAVAKARSLALELNVDARFVCSNIYDLPKNLDGQYDIVFTSYDVMGWLPDVARWAQVAAHFVKPGGTFYIAEFHPVAWVFDDSASVTDLNVKYPYFPTPEPLKFEEDGTYADRTANLQHRTTYSFSHSLGEIVTALIDAGLRIEHLHEFPFSTYQFLPFTERREDRKVYLTKHDGCVPLLYSIKATKPA